MRVKDMAQIKNKTGDFPFALAGSSTGDDPASHGIKLDAYSLSEGNLARDGNDLIVKLPDGQEVRHSGFFALPGAVVQITGSQAEITAGMLESMFPFLNPGMHLAQASSGTLSDASGTAAIGDGIAVARISTTTGNTYAVRGDKQIPLKPGDLVLDGDILITSNESSASIEFLRSDTGRVNQSLAGGNLGSNARIIITADRQSSENQTGVHVEITAGKVALYSLPTDNPTVRIETPVGQVATHGQDLELIRK